MRSPKFPPSLPRSAGKGTVQASPISDITSNSRSHDPSALQTTSQHLKIGPERPPQPDDSVETTTSSQTTASHSSITSTETTSTSTSTSPSTAPSQPLDAPYFLNQHARLKARAAPTKTNASNHPSPRRRPLRRNQESTRSSESAIQSDSDSDPESEAESDSDCDWASDSSASPAPTPFFNARRYFQRRPLKPPPQKPPRSLLAEAAARLSAPLSPAPFEPDTTPPSPLATPCISPPPLSAPSQSQQHSSPPPPLLQSPPQTRGLTMRHVLHEFIPNKERVQLAPGQVTYAASTQRAFRETELSQSLRRSVARQRGAGGAKIWGAEGKDRAGSDGDGDAQVLLGGGCDGFPWGWGVCLGGICTAVSGKIEAGDRWERGGKEEKWRIDDGFSVGMEVW